MAPRVFRSLGLLRASHLSVLLLSGAVVTVIYQTQYGDWNVKLPALSHSSITRLGGVGAHRGLPLNCMKPWLACSEILHTQDFSRSTSIHTRKPIIARVARVTRVLATSEGDQSLTSAPTVDMKDISSVPDLTGVYAILDTDQNVRYIGITKKIQTTLKIHRRDVPELAKYTKFCATGEDSSKEELQNKWREWVQESIELLGGIPDGNAKGNKVWAVKRTLNKPELKLTPGKGIEDLSVPIKSLLQQVVAEHKVVAFIKGSRLEPACGFSHSMVSEVSRITQDFEVVNVLDDLHNPGVRDAIKELSDWPTIPQLYVNGKFIGGADIVSEMGASDELKDIL
ncbi:hypothetical protein AAMO2058_001571300 [Amorphochlora amoebiformis]